MFGVRIEMVPRVLIFAVVGGDFGLGGGEILNAESISYVQICNGDFRR
jgi:hypothetical protein